MADIQTPQWFESLSETERRECAADLTDAYFTALSAGNWTAFHALVQQWLERAAQKQLVTA